MNKYARLVKEVQDTITPKRYVDSVWIKFNPKYSILTIDVVIDGSYSSVPSELFDLEIDNNHIVDNVVYEYFFEKRYIMSDKVCIYNKINGRRSIYQIFSELYQHFYGEYKILKEASMKADTIRREIL